MKHSLLSLIAALVFLLALSLPIPGVASDWPRFGGPDGGFSVDEPKLARTWESETAPEELWRLEVGEGFGGAAIVGDRAYIVDRLSGEKNLVRAIDLANGSEVWRHEDEVPGRVGYPGSRAVPTVTDDKVYAIGPFGNVYCIDRETGERDWKVDMQNDFSGEIPYFGYAGSPLLVGDKVIVTPFGPNGYGIAALDAATGDEMWHAEDILPSHSSPELLRLLGSEYVVFISSRGTEGHMIGVDPETGEVAWNYKGYPIFSAIPAPTAIGEDRLLITGGYNAGMQMLKASRDADGKIGFELLWKNEINARIHRPIITKDHIFILANDEAQGGGSRWMRSRTKDKGLVCMNLEGEILWETGSDPGFGHGAFILVGDLFIVQDGANGVLHLVEANTKAYTELGTYDPFQIEDRKNRQMWAPLAISEERLLVRSQNEFVCLKLPVLP